MIVSAVVLFPLSLSKNFSGLRYIAIASLFSLFFCLVVLVLELPFYIHYYIPKQGPRLSIVYANWSFEIFNAAGIVFFAFTNQAQLLPVYSELVNPEKRRIMKVISRSSVIVLIFYTMVALTGYFSTL